MIRRDPACLPRGQDVARFIKVTLLSATSEDGKDVSNAAKAAIKYLKENKFILWNPPEWEPTTFGRAAFASQMMPEDAIRMHDELEQARRQFVMSTDLHTLFLLTPPTMSVDR